MPGEICLKSSGTRVALTRSETPSSKTMKATNVPVRQRQTAEFPTL
jgi:hypothetical protein